MGLLSIFKRKSESSPVSEPVDDVQQARTRARQRLIGAVVLLAIGVVGFPLVFETQPRPIPVDIPIEIPRKEGAPPLVAPPVRAPAPLGSSSTLAGQGGVTERSGLADDVITESREESAGTGASAASSHPADAGSSHAASPKLAGKPEVGKVDSKAVAKADPADRKAGAGAGAGAGPAPGPGDDGARARALLEGKGPMTAAATDAGRYIVQVGAFADANAAQGTRTKIERLGLKTYTQVATTPAGNRIRVRVGPFPTRDEADKALAKARSAGLSAVVLVL